MENATDRSPNAAGRGRAGALVCLALLAGLWLHLFASLPGTWETQPGDLVAYHRAARLVLSGDAAELYRSDRQWFVNLPVVAGVLAPLGWLDYTQTWRLFWGLQVASFAATFGLLLWGLQRHFPPLTAPRALLAGATLLCFAPVLRRCLVLGQTTPMMVALLAGVWLLLRAGWPRAAGVLLGVVGLVKIPPLLLLPLLALRRRLSVAGTALAVVLTGLALSWLLFGGDLLAQWADRAIWSNSGGSFAAFNNRGLDGAWMRLLSDRSLLDWDPLPRPWPVLLALLASAAAVAALLLWRGWALVWPPHPPDDADPRTGTLELELALGVCLMLLVFPVVWVHYYLFLAVPLVLLPAWWLQRALPWRAWALALLLAGTWLASGSDVPPNHVYGGREGDALLRLAQNAQPLGALLLVLGLSQPLAAVARRSGAEKPRDPADPNVA